MTCHRQGATCRQGGQIVRARTGWKRFYPVMLVAASASAVPLAHAEKIDFERCDGLTSPGDKADGLSNTPTNHGFITQSDVDTTQRIQACSLALADPRLLPEQGLRRANLLRARAFAHLASGQPDNALADVNAAEAATADLRSDPLFTRSMGVSFMLMRAMIWQVKGDSAQANALAQIAAGARPYSISVQSIAAAIIQRAPSPHAAASPYQPLAVLMPEARLLQFSDEIDVGHFAQAARLYPSLMQVPSRGGTPTPGSFMAERNRRLTLPLISAKAAYAYAATSQSDAAHAAMARAQDQATQAFSTQTTFASAPQMSALTTTIAQWAVLTNARLALAQQRPANAVAMLAHQALPVNAAMLDLMLGLQQAFTAQRKYNVDPAKIEAMIKVQQQSRKLDIESLKLALIPPETSRRLVDYKQSHRSILNEFVASGYVPDGFRSKLDRATGLTTVEFDGQSASSPVVEEMTLLHAADLARQQGKSGIVIEARRDYAKVRTVTRRGSDYPISSRAAGYKTELDIRFVDRAAVAADPGADRVLDVAQVYGALAPVYIAAR